MKAFLALFTLLLPSLAFAAITIRPGAPVRLRVHSDLILKPWKERE